APRLSNSLTTTPPTFPVPPVTKIFIAFTFPFVCLFDCHIVQLQGSCERVLHRPNACANIGPLSMPAPLLEIAAEVFEGALEVGDFPLQRGDSLAIRGAAAGRRSEEHTSELQSLTNL